MKITHLIFLVLLFPIVGVKAQSAKIDITPSPDSAVKQILSLTGKKKCIFVAIGGEDLSGRTQLTDDIYQGLSAKGLNVSILRLTQYRTPYAKCQNVDLPGSCFYENEIDYATLNKEIIQPLKKSRKLNKKIKLNGSTPATFSYNNLDVLLVEGSMTLRSSYANWFNIRLWTDCSMATLRERYAARKAGNVSAISDYPDSVLLAAHSQLLILDEPVDNADYSFVTDERLKKDPELIIFEDFKGPKISSGLHWLNQPKTYKIQNGELFVQPESYTNMWQQTYYGYTKDNAPFLHFDTEKDFVLTAQIRFEPENKSDQAGIAIRIDKNNWIRASLEYISDKRTRINSTVTNDGFSDAAFLPDYFGQDKSILWKITRIGNDFTIEYLKGGQWVLVRVAHLSKAEGKIQCGLFSCSPQLKANKVYFDFLKIEGLLR
jgi:uncharacterized protein